MCEIEVGGGDIVIERSKLGSFDGSGLSLIVQFRSRHNGTPPYFLATANMPHTTTPTITNVL